MKKLFLFLLMACALTSCDVPEARANLKKYIASKEETRLPIVLQAVTINSPEVLGIEIDSVQLCYVNEGAITPASAYLVTTWKIKKEIMVSEEYAKYDFLYDEYSDYETKKFLVELSDFKDVDLGGNAAKYNANWPNKNPFNK